MSKQNTLINLGLWPLILVSWPHMPKWLWQTLTHTEYQLNLWLGVAFLIVAGVKLSRTKWSGIQTLPLEAALIIGGALAAQLTNKLTADLNIISAASFLVALYGASATLLPQAVWRNMRIVALMFVVVLPFNAHLETYVGFPLRAVTANIVAATLSPLQPSLTAGVVLQLENTIASVDIPCSGVKSLWTGAVFFCLFTMLFQKRIGWRWLGLSGLYVIGIVAGNTFRVLCLMTLHYAQVSPELIDALHTPIGLLPFLAVSAAAAKLMTYLPRADTATRRQPRTPSRLVYGVVFGTAIALVVLGPPPQSLGELPPAVWRPPADLNAQAIPLSEAEDRLFTQTGADLIAKYRFNVQGRTGSFLLVRSKNWRSHHNPTQCMTLLTAKDTLWQSRPAIIKPNIAVRLLEQQGTKGMFWFRQDDYTTGDYTERVFKGMLNPTKPWVMITVVFDRPISNESPTEVVHLLNEAAKQLTVSTEESKV